MLDGPLLHTTCYKQYAATFLQLVHFISLYLITRKFKFINELLLCLGIFLGWDHFLPIVSLKSVSNQPLLLSRVTNFYDAL